MGRLTTEQAADLTLDRLASENGGAAYLSGDIVATCCAVHERPIISIIHLDDRRHWNLTVRVEAPAGGEIDRFVPVADLAAALDTARDGDYWLVTTPEGRWWTLTVDVLELAKV